MPPRPAMRSENILVAVERASSHAQPLENGHENHKQPSWMKFIDADD
jgi:hypothetical protein